ncbi:metallophosphoesterase [Nocardioides sp. L-11A]|uniref:metallophosphoesterase n=1 Tax=Nocardioides sp. L-11A TaxID=3043848 RepID=UPI00249A3493|nr:Ig-like domain repeat protein [Nocardioides sp. L-11A]
MNIPALRRVLVTALSAAVAAGALAVTAPSAEAADPTLISTATTTWRYLDDGTDPAAGLPDRTDWADPGFDDTAWRSAKGSFGAKNGALASVSGFVPNTLLTQYKPGGTTDIEAFFFRTEVTVPPGALAGVTSLAAAIRYDDAATVYVNGTRVAGFDDASITANLSYGGSNADVPKLAEFTMPVSAFHEGANTIAVELHQGRASSSDIYLDFVSASLSTAVAPAVSDVILNIGADEKQRNVNWYSTGSAAQSVQYLPAADLVGGAFPATGAEAVTSVPSPANEAGKTAHKATLGGLSPSTEYAYRVGTDGAWSDIATFTTGDFDNNYDFIYVGDPQIGSSGNVANDSAGWADTLAKASIQVPTAEWLLSAGDQVDSAANEQQYDGFLSPHQVTELATSTTVGNHEAGSRSTYYQHYNLPNYDEASGDYWYTYGDTLFLNLDSNFNTEAQRAAHVAWMEATIAANPDTTWQVVVMHHALYSSGPHATDSDVLQRRAYFPDQFKRLGIDLALAGHDHVYTRSHPMDGGTPAPLPADAPAEIQAGQGKILYLTASSASGSKYYGNSNAGASWVAVTSQPNVPQFTRVSVSDAEIGLTTYRTDTMAVVDEITLLAPDDGPEVPADWRVPEARQRLPFAVRGEGLSGPVTGFPVLLTFDDDDLDFAVADPDRLVFTAGDDPTPLPYQVERWDRAGTSVWVRVPRVDATGSEVELYFDGAPQNTTTATDVWDDDYIAVHHFASPSGDFPDATANGWAGSTTGSASVYGAPSESGTPAYQITGAGTYVDYGTAMAADATEQVTFSTSILIDPAQCTASDTGYRVIAGRDVGGGKVAGETYSLVCYQGKVFPRFVVDNVGVNASGGNALASAAWSPGWHDVTTTFDGTTIRTYVDGEQAAAHAISGAIGDGLAPPRFVVDGYSNTPGGVKMSIDEMRLSRVARSADWIKAESLARSGRLTTVGQVESAGQLQLSVTSPAEGAVLPEGDIALAGTTSSAEVTYAVDGADPVSLGQVNGAYAATLAGLEPGTHTVVVTATAGDSQKSVTRRFSVAAVAPEGAPRLSLTDGDLVSGTIDIVASRPGGDADGDVAIEVDGEPLEVRAAEETAQAVFDVSGWQTGFVQDVRVNGESIHPPRTDVNGTLRLDIPEGILREGANTLRISTGSSARPEDTAANNDDFTITDPRLELGNSGTVLRDPAVDPAAPLFIGDGFPAGTANPTVYFREFTLTVEPGALTTYAATWDTSLGADGRHTVAATTEGGTTTAAVDVDNTAPTVTFHEPVDGGRYKGSFTVDVRAEDPHEVDTLTLDLDGEPVAQGTVVDVDTLGPGEHTLTAHAVDKLGNTVDVPVTFDTVGNAPNEPGDPRPADGATGVDPAGTELSVTATDPAGDALDVEFLRGYQGGVSEVAEGATKAALPGRTAGTAATADALAAADGTSLTTAGERSYPFQRFEVDVPTDLAGDEFTVTWRGAVPDGDRAALSVWDHAADRWQLLAEGTGSDLTLEAAASVADTVRDGTATVLVQDVPEVVLDDDDVTTISWLTDTQYYAARETATYEAQIKWTLDHRISDDIAYGVHTGDLVDAGSSVAQWQNASRAHEPWDAAGFPYGVVPGNHDIASGQYETYRTYFGAARFQDNPWYGGTNQDNVQHYDVFSTPDADYLFLYVDWSLSQDEIDWANEVIASHPDHNVVIGTHQYLLNGGSYVTPGQTIFDEIVLPNANVKMILSGHTPGVAMNVKRPSAGRVVVEVMQDSQAVGYAGDGWMRTFDMDATNQTTTHRTFSVTKPGNNFAGNGTEFVAPDGWSGTSNAENFTVPMDITRASREIATDALTVTTRSTQRIGDVVHVESGERATVGTGALDPATSYQWFARVTDADGHRTDSPVWGFTTADQAEPTATSVSLAFSGDPVEGTALTFAMGVTPADAAGSVELFDGTTSLGRADVVSGVAELVVSDLAEGVHALSAEFTPADATAFAGSTSRVLSVRIAPRPEQPGKARPTMTVRSQPSWYGRSAVVVVDVAAGATPASGTVRVSVAGEVLEATLNAAGRARFALDPGLTPGTWPLLVNYTGSDTVEAGYAAGVATVDRVPTVVEAKTKKRIKAARRAKVVLTVRAVAGGPPAGGPVRVKVDGKVRRAVVLAEADGTLRLRLPRLPRGRHKIVVLYDGSATHEAARSRKQVVTVR